MNEVISGSDEVGQAQLGGEFAPHEFGFAHAKAVPHAGVLAGAPESVPDDTLDLWRVVGKRHSDMQFPPKLQRTR